MKKIELHGATLTRISRAFRQAPWRTQIQVAAGAAVVVLAIIVLSSVFLLEASRTGNTGRDIQALEARKLQLIRENAELRAQLAELRAEKRLSARARELGYRPARIEEMEYLVIDGYPGPQSLAATLNSRAALTPAQTRADTADTLANLSESASEWFARSMFGVTAEAAEGLR